MPVSDFVFAMSFARREQYDVLIGDLAAVLFKELGFNSKAVESVVAELKGIEMPGSGTQDGPDVRFHGQDGACQVVITVQGREVLRRALRP